MLKTVIFDFDGVLMPNGSFWAEIDNIYPGMWKKFEKEFWRSEEAMPIIKDWKKGKLKAAEIITYLSEKFNLDPILLQNELIKSVKAIKVDPQLLSFANQLKNQGIKTAILTDHMDTFLEIIVPNNKLDETFDYIICSAAYGMLKTEEEGALLLKAVNIIGTEMENALFIDDWDLVCNLVKHNRGMAFWYKNENANPQALLHYINQNYKEVKLK